MDGIKINDISKKKRTTYPKHYNPKFVQFGFIAVNDGDPNGEKPQCVICGTILSNQGMTMSKLKRHLIRKHPDIADRPREYFEIKTAAFKARQKTVPSKNDAVWTSYKVALHINKTIIPYTRIEYMKNHIEDDSASVIGEVSTSEIDFVPLSKGTMRRRTKEIADDIETQLVEQIKQAKYFSLQLDEYADTNLPNLLVYVRYEHDGDITEELFFPAALSDQPNSLEVFKILEDNIVHKFGLDLQFCLGLCTDASATLTGKNSDLMALIKQAAPQCKITHCILHKESLASERTSPELYEVLCDVIKVVDYIKSRPYRSICKTLCRGIDPEHKRLITHVDHRWLSSGNVLNQIFKLSGKIAVFLKEENSSFTMFSDENWLAKLAYLTDIFNHFNEFNKSMEDTTSTCYSIADSIDEMKDKLTEWKCNVQADRYDVFGNVYDTINEAGSKIDRIHLRGVIGRHLNSLSELFDEYFPPDEDVRKNNVWIRNPFDSLVNLMSNPETKQAFYAKSLTEFWIGIKAEHPKLYESAIEVLLPFTSTRLCERVFLTSTYIKSKYRSRIDLCNPLRLALTNIEPRLDILTKNKLNGFQWNFGRLHQREQSWDKPSKSSDSS